MTELVHVKIDADIAWITLDSPHNRNALSRELTRELLAGLERCRSNDVRVVVLSGTGRVFCSGADLVERRQSTDGPTVDQDDAAIRMMTTLYSFPKPLVGLINGHVRAGGLGLLACCDIAVAPDWSTYAFSEVRLGLVPAVISVPVLAKMDRNAARRYFLTGEAFSATTAATVGLLTAAVSDCQLNKTVDELVAELLKGSPAAQAVVKDELLRCPGELEAARADFDRLEALSLRMFASKEAGEGMAAFAEKRPPRWVNTRAPRDVGTTA
jgi:methylglutaconyl-CoA hydratase